MASNVSSSSQRLAWVEGIRFFAVVMILIYHAQLLITDYAFTPQPAGLAQNLQILESASDRLGDGFFIFALSFPGWFGFQFVDVFILISGFSLVMSMQGKTLDVVSFIKRRLFRILWPFWTVAWLAFPILWAIGVATDSYVPAPWDIFAGVTFPLLFDFEGTLLLHSNGPWWFIPLILSFAIISPFLWQLLQRWGARNLLIVSLVITLTYRILAVYRFEGHPTYTIGEPGSDWSPFLTVVAKLSTFVIGMAIAHAYCRGQGPLYWPIRKVLTFGITLYTLGFVCQFYKAGWILADVLLPVGLLLCLMVVFRPLANLKGLKPILLWLGLHSYSYYLIHNFLVDRTLNLVVQQDVTLYVLLLPFMIIGTLILAVLADYTTPFLKRSLLALIRDIDYVLTVNPDTKTRIWSPQVGDRVLYGGQGGWTVIKVEQLLDDKEMYLCQVTDGQKTMWINEDELELEQHSPLVDRRTG